MRRWVGAVALAAGSGAGAAISAAAAKPEHRERAAVGGALAGMVLTGLAGLAAGLIDPRYRSAGLTAAGVGLALPVVANIGNKT